MGTTRRSRWNSCLMWFAASICGLCLTLSRSCASTNLGTESVPSIELDGSESNRNLVLVSTIDGRLSALDIQDDGQLLWSIAADSRPLLSSSISKLEIMHDGIPTRYIPSLDGGLYRYNGASIEAVPLSAEKLLSSSYKLSEDTMMIGGKDTVTYGLDPVTGEVRYACGLTGCRTFGELVQDHEDILIVNRRTQTVRAVDSRYGSEKWNFSVGEHDVTFIKGQRQTLSTSMPEKDQETDGVTCTTEVEDDDFSSAEKMKLINSVKILVPDGMVVGVDPDNMHSVTWQHKFKSPVSNVWLLYKGDLQKIDMFENKNIPALSSFESEEQPLHSPLLYVGLHDKQLYVQSSTQMKEKMASAEERFIDDSPPRTCQNEKNPIPRVAWKPYLNTAHWRTPSMNNRVKQITSDADSSGEICEDGDNALVIWHENYPFDNGFYLYPEFSVHVPLTEDGKILPNKTAKVSSVYVYETIIDKLLMIWNWWKEVVGISVLVSTIMHMIMSRLPKKEPETPNQVSSSQSVDSITASDSAGNLPNRQNSDEYISRYAADFDHLEVLGRGGFGVVFEAKNKVDECHYAIKRITLPNSEGAKDKVMREAKTLAKLDHIGIVRYFHAWIESPPPGWQEDKDQLIEYGESMTSPTQFTKSPNNVYNQNIPAAQTLEHSCTKIVKKNINPSPFDLLKNPFGENIFEFSQKDLNRGGSEEFSVHSVDESGWGIEESSGGFVKQISNSKNDDCDDESGSFSCGMGAPTLNVDSSDDSLEIEFIGSDQDSNMNVNNPKQNIPKYNDENSSSMTGLDSIVNFDETDNSLHIVFEDSGCGDKSSKSSSGDVCIGIVDGITNDRKTENTASAAINIPSNIVSNCSDPTKNSPPVHFTLEQETKDEKINSLHSPKLFLYIQMQLCRRETLKDWLASNTLNRDRQMVLDMFDQIVSAIEYVHDCGLMHRDLKPSNIFFSIDGVVKMGDFGLVTALAEEQNETLYGGNPYKKHTSQVGTQLYMSPEQKNGETYSQKVDIFSLGVILFELLYPFGTQMERVDTLMKVRKREFPERFTREMPKEADFVKKLLSQVPENRPSAKEILSSDLLKEFEDRRMPRRFRARTVSQNSS